MFSIIVNGTQIDHSGIAVNLYLKSTFPFDPDQGQIEGSFAFNGRLPASPLNKRIFGFPGRFEGTFGPPADLPCQLSINGRIWYEGLITITSSTGEWLNFDLLIGFGYFSALIKDKSLKDLSFPALVSIGADTPEVIAFANECVTKTYPGTLVNFPMIYAPHFYGEDKDKNPTYLDFINHYSSAQASFIQNYYNSSAGVRNVNTLVPMLYLVHVTKLCFETFGYEPTGPFFKDPEIMKMLLFNNFALDEFRKKYLVIASQTAEEFLIDWEDLPIDDDVSGDNEDADGCYDPSAHAYEIKVEGDYGIQLSFEMFNSSGAERLFEIRLLKDGVKINGQGFHTFSTSSWEKDSLFFNHYFEAADVGSLLKLQARVVDISGNLKDGKIRNAKVSYENFSYSQMNVFARTIDFRNHVPDKEISDFLISLQVLFGIAIGFDHEKKTAEISFTRDLLRQIEAANLSETAEVSSQKFISVPSEGYAIKYAFDSSDQTSDSIREEVDLANFIGVFNTHHDLPYPSKLNDLAYVRNTNCYYIFNVDAGPGPYWNFLCHYHPVKRVGDGIKEVSCDMSPLMMHWNPGRKNIYPIVLQEGTSLAMEDTVNDFGLRLMIFHGLQPYHTGSGTYPLASSGSYNSDGISVGGLDLSISGDKGLFARYLSEYYAWLTGAPKQLTAKTLMTYSKLKSLDLFKIYRIFNSRYLIKDAKVKVNNDDMAEVELECRKVL